MNELKEFLNFTEKFLRINKNYGLVPIVRNDGQIIINPDGIKPGAIIRDEEEFLALLKEYKEVFFSDTSKYTQGKNYHHHLHFLLKNATYEAKLLVKYEKEGKILDFDIPNLENDNVIRK